LLGYYLFFLEALKLTEAFGNEISK